MNSTFSWLDPIFCMYVYICNCKIIFKTAELNKNHQISDQIPVKHILLRTWPSIDDYSSLIISNRWSIWIFKYSWIYYRNLFISNYFKIPRLIWGGAMGRCKVGIYPWCYITKLWLTWKLKNCFHMKGSVMFLHRKHEQGTTIVLASMIPQCGMTGHSIIKLFY